MNRTNKLKLISSLLFLLSSFTVWAQTPANDDCAGAILIANPVDYCSEIGEFDNGDATASGFGPATCWTENSHDVWFSFVAVNTSVNVTVNGFSGNAGGGTLLSPQLALYGGSCSGTINELECEAGAPLVNIIELNQGGLVPGTTYFIRVDGFNTRNGTFQLCVRNFNPPAAASSDCINAAVLCDKSSFAVPVLVGGGADDTELNDADCFSNGLPNVTNEFNSVWFKWICDEAGPLTFSLTPLNPIDDIDFVVYELNNGIDDCTSKTVLRCMAAGENEANYPSPCHGPTGLRANDSDTSEPAGCDQNQNNWLQPLNMESGKAYALAINNFTDSGSGIQIDFGGTGTFLGPNADFTASSQKVCFGEPITFTDASTFSLGTIVAWEWNFGVGANPSSASGILPHQVNWDAPGIKSIVLQVETDRGCTITQIRSIEVEPCCEDVNAISASAIPTDVLCADDLNGAINLTATSNVAITSYAWSNGSIDEDINGLGAGSYTVTIENAATCDTVFTFEVGVPLPIVAEVSIIRPTCMGGADGAINLNVSGGIPPYEYNWGMGFQNDNSRTNLEVDDYTVIIRDANGCEEVMTIEVRELELLLNPDIPTITTPSCYNSFDGSISLNVSNGLGPFQFDWNDGNGFVNRNELQNINAGTYVINFRDANGCVGDTTVVVLPPLPLTVDIDPIDVSCFGAEDGSGVPFVSGGVGNYSFEWSEGQTDSIAVGLDIGEYTLTVTDGNGCDTTAIVEIVQPLELFIEVLSVENILCNGGSTGSILVEGSGGNPSYEFSIDGTNFQLSSEFGGLAAGDYTIAVRDEMGCVATVMATLIQPDPLIVDAGEDKTVELGFSERLFAITSPIGRPVTYEWTPADSTLSCTDCFNPLASPVNTQKYYVLVTDETGCTALDSITVNVVKNRPIYIPNAFSPNGDGFNDIFTVYGGPAARQVQLLRVFNRWGALIYEASNIPLNSETLGWNGRFKSKDLHPAVFAYYAIVEFVDDETVLFEGDITITK